MGEKKESPIERQKRRKETECKHFSGPIHNKACKAGVLYREMVGGEEFGWMARMPCMPDSPLRKEPMAICDKYEIKAPAEIMAEEIAQRTRTGKLLEALTLIRGTKQSSGTIECPTCEKRLHFTVAKINDHIWGRCETEGCMSWMM